MMIKLFLLKNLDYLMIAIGLFIFSVGFFSFLDRQTNGHFLMLLFGTAFLIPTGHVIYERWFIRKND
jgi:hypothetical protein